jgi:hypothetical protein
MECLSGSEMLVRAFPTPSKHPPLPGRGRVQVKTLCGAYAKRCALRSSPQRFLTLPLSVGLKKILF